MRSMVLDHDRTLQEALQIVSQKQEPDGHRSCAEKLLWSLPSVTCATMFLHPTPGHGPMERSEMRMCITRLTMTVEDDGCL